MFLYHGNINKETLRLWRLEGVDCSGLLYQATGGYTPRNTSSMKDFGDEVKISGLPLEQISFLVRPLDLIVCTGHVVIVLNGQPTAVIKKKSGGLPEQVVERQRATGFEGKIHHIFQLQQHRSILGSKVANGKIALPMQAAIGSLPLLGWVSKQMPA